jgi:hypothetical protein
MHYHIWYTSSGTCSVTNVTCLRLYQWSIYTKGANEQPCDATRTVLAPPPFSRYLWPPPPIGRPILAAGFFGPPALGFPAVPFFAPGAGRIAPWCPGGPPCAKPGGRLIGIPAPKPGGGGP